MSTLDALLADERANRYRLALLHFAFFFGIGAFVPYMTLYLAQILVRPDGTPANNLIGMMIFLNQGLGIFGAPVAGIVADKYRLEHGIIAICAIAAALGATLLALPAFTAIDSLGVTVVLVAVGMMIIGFFSRPIPSLVDTQTLKHLDATRGDSSEYGRFRLLGSAGFVVATVTIGVLLALTNRLGLAVVAHAAVFVVIATVSGQRMSSHVERVKIPWKHLRQNVPFRRFLLFMFFVSSAIYSAFIFTGYFLDEIDAGFVVMGLAFGASALPEVPIMYKAGAIARKFGLRGMIVIGCSAQVVKLVLFVLLAGSPATWAFIVVSTLHGSGYALIHIGGVRFSDNYAHPDMRATYQNLFSVVRAAGIAIGGPLSGLVLTIWNSTVLMGICAAMIAIGTVYFVLALRGSGDAPAAEPA